MSETKKAMRGPRTGSTAAMICGQASARRAARAKTLQEKAALVFASCSDEQLAEAGLLSIRREDGTRAIAAGDLVLVEVQTG
jgi:hypothetical protein